MRTRRIWPMGLPNGLDGPPSNGPGTAVVGPAQEQGQVLVTEAVLAPVAMVVPVGGSNGGLDLETDPAVEYRHRSSSGY